MADSQGTHNQETKQNSSIDQGWAWVVAIGISLWNMIIAGTIKCYGVFYLEFLDLFHGSAVSTSWMSASFTLTLSLAGPFAGLIKDKCAHNTTRVVVAISGAVAAASFVACAWTDSTIAATLFFGIVPGLASAAIDPSVLCCVGVYFIEHRVFANCIAFSGGSVGGFVLPLFITWATETYTTRGALIILGGIWLHILVVASIIRPLSASDTKRLRDCHRNETSKKANVIDNKKNTTSPEENGVVVDETWFGQHGDLFIMHMGVLTSENTNNSNAGTVEMSAPSTHNARSTCMEHVNDYWRFMKTPGLLLLCSVFTIASLAYFTQFFIIPPLVEELGMSKEFASIILMIISAIELISRLLFGFVIEKLSLKKTMVLFGSLVIAAVAGFVMNFMSSKFWLIVYAVVIGLFGGLSSPLALPMMMEISPMDKYGSCAGLFPLLSGVGITVGPPVVGATKQYGGSYKRGLLILASAYLAAALVLVVKFLKDVRKTRTEVSTVTNQMNECTHF